MSAFCFIVNNDILYVLHESIISAALKKNSEQASDKLIAHVCDSGILNCGLAGYKFTLDDGKIVGTSMYPTKPTFMQMCDQLNAWNQLYGAVSSELIIDQSVMRIFD